MISVVNIPDEFVVRYRPFLAQWVAGMKAGTWSGECGIPLVGGAAEVADVDENGERPWLVAWLVAKRWRGDVVVMPRSREDWDLIKRHVAEIGSRPELPVDFDRKRLN